MHYLRLASHGRLQVIPFFGIIGKVFLHLCRKSRNFAVLSGVLAQLARAIGSQSIGQGFDSPILHKNSGRLPAVFGSIYIAHVTPLAPPAPIPPFGGIFSRYPPGASSAYPPRGEPSAKPRADTPNVAGHDVLRSRSAFFGPPATQIGLSALPALQVGDYLGTCCGTRHHLQRNSVQPATQLVHTRNTTRLHLQRRDGDSPVTAKRPHIRRQGLDLRAPD